MAEIGKRGISRKNATMVRLSRPLILLTVPVGFAVSLLWIFSDRMIGHAMATGAVKDFHQMTAGDLEREIRNKVPIGSPLTMVKGFLNERGIEFSFEASSKTLYATA
jgi:hypothetical protein